MIPDMMGSFLLIFSYLPKVTIFYLITSRFGLSTYNVFLLIIAMALDFGEFVTDFLFKG